MNASELLKQALSEHGGGNETKAKELYESSIKEGIDKGAAYQNLGAIYKKEGKNELALETYWKGLVIEPKDHGIWGNLGNLYFEKDEYIQAIRCFRNSIKLGRNTTDMYIMLCKSLSRGGYKNLAIKLFKYKESKVNGNERKNLYVAFFEILGEGYKRLEEEQREGWREILEEAEKNVLNTSDNDDNKIWDILLLSQSWMVVGECDKSIKLYWEGRQNIVEMIGKKKNGILKQDFQKKWHALSWNMSISLLKSGYLKDGWKLFDHGLMVSAEGVQKWQRSLKKPFSEKSVNVWRGENLEDKKILVLGEQGIGDTVMFMSIVKNLEVYKGCQITIMPGDRLAECFRRKEKEMGWKVVTLEDIQDGKYDQNDWDYMTASGSIPQYLSGRIEDYAQHDPIAKADSRKTKELREKYEKENNIKERDILVGISWQGGGKPSRIGLKSMKLKTMAEMLNIPNIKLISLQYGDDAGVIERYCKQSNANIIHDPSIDPVLRYDEWLSQVDACDCIVSVANTTVHGAGSLGKPCFTFVTNKRDWRWIDPEIYKGCYWYKSVEVGYQARDGSWSEAMNSCREWLEKQKSNMGEKALEIA